MKFWSLAGLLLLIGIGSILITTNVFLGKNNLIKTEVVEVDFEVNTFAGIMTNNDALHFGTLVQGGGGRRWFNFTNDETYPIEVSAKFVGEAADYLYWFAGEVILQPGEFRIVEIRLIIPDDLPHGNYTAQAQIFYRRAD